MKKIIKIAFIGYGYFARVRTKTLQNNNYCKLVGFYDPYFSGDAEIKQFNDFNTLINETDAVFISVPNKFAAELTAICLRRGKHVFCEKPAAITFDELTRVEPFINNDLILAYGFNHRVHPSIKKIKDTLDSGSLGKILWARGRYGKEIEKKIYKDTWRCNKNLSGGGIIIDQGIHMIDLIFYLIGDFDHVSSILSNSYLNIEGIEDNAFITLGSKKTKISASIHSTITQWRYLFSLEIFTEKGSIILNGLRTNSGNYGDEILTIKIRNEDGSYDEQKFEFYTNTSIEEENNAFIGSILNEKDYPYAKFEDASKITKVIDQIYHNADWI